MAANSCNLGPQFIKINHEEDVYRGVTPKLYKERMMKSLKLFLVLAIAASSFATVMPQKRRPFLEWMKKHRAPIAAGIAATVAIGVAAVGLTYHGIKVKKALDQAGINSNYEYYDVAIAAVGLLGPLGKTKTLKLFKNALEKKLLTYDEAAMILLPPIGKALAYYFGVNPAAFQAEAAVVVGKTAVKIAVQKAKEALGKLKSNITRLLF